jgi:hypothetical protein
MTTTTQPTASASAWKRLAWITGLGSLVCYFAAAFVPLPGPVTMVLAFAFGPLLTISFLGMYRFFGADRDTPLLQVACLAGVIAGVLVTTMLVIQVGNNMVREDTLADATSQAGQDAARVAWRAVNRVQYLVDVVWDIFICIATILLGAYLMAQRGFGRVWGGVGVLAGLGLLVLNLWTFPYAPGETGSIDLGPLVALWMGAVFVRLALLKLPVVKP